MTTRKRVRKTAEGRAAWVRSAAYLAKPDVVEGDEDDRDYHVADYTNVPKRYSAASLRRRLIPVLARLPRRVLHVLTREREVVFYASPNGPGIYQMPPGEIDASHGAHAVPLRALGDDSLTGHWRIMLGRVAIECASPLAFAGTVVHELAHAYCQHSDAYMGDYETDNWLRQENEAWALACKWGFRREAAASLRLAKRVFGESMAQGSLPPQKELCS
jgi:hypothetical protein